MASDRSCFDLDLTNAVRDILAGRRAVETPVHLPFESTYVNMEIDATPLSVDIADWSSDDTLVDGKIVIPVLHTTHSQAG